MAAAYQEEFGRHNLIQSLTACLEKEAAKIPPLWQMVATLPVDLILSTDMDHRLEQALTDAGRKFRVQIGPEEGSAGKPEAGGLLLIKLYGDVDVPESLAITEEDLRARHSQLKNETGFLQTRLNTGHLFFLGFRWRNSHFKDLYRSLTARLSPTRIRATGLSAKIAPAVRGAMANLGLELCAAEELELLPRLEAAAKRATELTQDATHESKKLVSGPLGAIKRPYKFLSYFEEDDEEIFFGREEEKSQLFGLVVSNRLTLLHGASGAGKSSLLNAGVLPLLRREGYLAVVCRALRDPAREIRESVMAVLPKAKVGQLGSEKGPLPLPVFLAQATATLAKPLVVVVDQFEEFFIRFSKKARQVFIAELAQVVKNKILDVHFVLSLRHDFLSSLSECKAKIPDVFHHELRIANLSPEGMAQAMEEPAELAGLSFEEGLVERILTDLGLVGSEPPQLQIVCDRLYDQLSEEEDVFTRKHYQDLGEAKGILGSYLEQFIQVRAPEQRVLARDVLKALVTSVGTKTVATSAMVVQETGRPPKAVREVLTQLLEARLLRKLVSEEGESYELSHEYLIEEIGKWVDEHDRELKQARELLRQEMTNHQQFGLWMAPARMEIIKKNEKALALNKDEKEFLAQSTHRQRKKALRWSAVVALLVILGIVASFGIVKNLKMGLCDGSEAKLVGVWEPDLANEVHKRFLATDKPYAEDTFVRVQGLLDKYAANWVAMRRQTCEATRVSGEQSETWLDLRMHCLDRRLSEFQALTELYAAQADVLVLDQAVTTAHRLTNLSVCADARQLARAFPLPEDRAAQTEVAKMRSSLDRAKVLNDAGKYRTGIQLATEVEEANRELNYLPIEAKLKYLRGVMWTRLREAIRSEKDLLAAIKAAALVKNDKLAAKVMTKLIFTMGYLQQRYDQALALGPIGEAMVARAGDDPKIRADLYNSLASIEYRQGEGKKAEKYFDRALATVEQMAEPDLPLLANILFNVASNKSLLGENEESLKILRRVLSLREQVLGPNHPRVGLAQSGIGNNLAGQDRCAEAISIELLALGKLEASFGRYHNHLVLPLSVLGKCYLETKQADQAVVVLERAVAIQQKHPADEFNLIWSRFYLAQSLMLTGGDKRRAIELAQLAYQGLLQIAESRRGGIEQIRQWLELQPTKSKAEKK